MSYLMFTSDTVSFGAIGIGLPIEMKIGIINPSDRGTHIIGNVGALSGAFSVVSGGGAFDLLEGQSLEVVVRFTPTVKATYNTNLVITHDASNPPSPKNIFISGSGSDLSIRIGVKIETASGFFFRTSDKETIVSAGTISFEKGIVSYPDLRVKSFFLYVQNTASGSSFLKKEYEAKYSEKCNFAYAILHADGGSIDPSEFTETITEEELNNLNQLDYGDPNSVLVSETYQPRSLLGANANAIGNSSDDGLITFGVNAQPVSAGQFGQFPLFAFAKRGIWLVTVGDGVKFDRVIPFSLNDEILGKNAVLAYKNVLFFLTKRGLNAYAEGSMKNVSAPLHNPKGNSPFLASLDGKSSLAYFKDEETGREEIWVGTRFGIWAYSLGYDKWFYIDQRRDSFVNVFGKTIGYDSLTAAFYYENNGSKADGSFRTAPIHLDIPEQLKRFRRTWYTKNDAMVSIPSQTARMIEINETIDKDVVDMGEVNLEYEFRYPHRTGENESGGEG